MTQFCGPQPPSASPQYPGQHCCPEAPLPGFGASEHLIFCLPLFSSHLSLPSLAAHPPRWVQYDQLLKRATSHCYLTLKVTLGHGGHVQMSRAAGVVQVLLLQACFV